MGGSLPGPGFGWIWKDVVATFEWFAVQVWSGREHFSASHLRLRGYEIFLPCYQERRRWTDRVKVVDRPLFAGYIFARAERNPGRIVTAPGVIRILGDVGGPVSIPVEEIEAIQRIIDARVQAGPWPAPQAGHRVRIDAGPLSGVEGTILLAKGRNRLIVTISLLQRAVAAEIDSAWITIPLGAA